MRHGACGAAATPGAGASPACVGVQQCGAVVSLLSFALLAASPIPGLLAAIPLGVLVLGYPPWAVALACVPLSYAQVAVVDRAWDGLERWAVVRRALVRARTPRTRAWLDGGATFWPTVLVTGLLGPWVVMALVRAAGGRQARVAAPVVVAIALVSFSVSAACAVAPEWFSESTGR